MIRHYESCRHSPLTSDDQRRMAHLLLESQAFDLFLSKRFPSVKRYGCEGAESMLVFFDWLFAGADVRDVIVCMPHRGRLNLLTGLLGLSPTALFHKVCWCITTYATLSSVAGYSVCLISPDVASVF